MEKVTVSGGHDNVGNIFEDSDNGNGIVFERRHACKEHETKEDVDRGPQACGSHVERWIIDPFEAFAQIDGRDSDNGLKYD